MPGSDASVSQVNSTKTGKILPLIRSDSKEYWAAAAENRFVVQRCKDCGKFQFYPRSLCHYCHSEGVEWVQPSGRATVHTYTQIFRPPTSAYADEVPYVLALVDLVEGPRMMTKIITEDPDSVEVGMDVEVTFEKIDEKITLPCFRPA